MNEQVQPDPREARGMLVATVTLFVCVAVAAAVWWGATERAEQRRAAEVAAARARWEPAPTLSAGPKVRLKGKLVSSWIVQGAGTSAYNGTYAESGTYGGKAAYTAGGKWLWWHVLTTRWALSANKGDIEISWAYYTDSDDLPGTSWQVAAGGSANAPTVTEYVALPEVTPWTWPYPYYIYYGGPALTILPLRPCACTLGGVDYVAIAHTTGILLFKISDHSWHNCTCGATMLASYDAQQTGALFDAGNGTHLWCFSGAYDDSGAKVRCSYLAVTADTSTVEDSFDIVTLPSLDVSNPVQLAAGGDDFYWMGLDSGVWKLYAYTGGDAATTTAATFGGTVSMWGTVVELGATGRADQVLYLAPYGGLFWFRRHNNGVTAFAVSTSSCLSSPYPIWMTGPDCYQAYGWHPERNMIICDYGGTDVMGNEYAAWEWHWLGGQKARPCHVGPPVTRRWFVEPTSCLLVAGWTDASLDGRPFVLDPSVSGVAMSTITAGTYFYSPTVAKAAPLNYIMAATTFYEPYLTARDIVPLAVIQAATEFYEPSLVGVVDRTKGAATANIKRVRVRNFT